MESLAAIRRGFAERAGGARPKPRPDRPRWSGPPLALQIMALLVGGLVIAQLVTLVLTLLLPPQPTPQYGLDDIAAALSSEEAAGASGLQRVSQAGPPDVNGPGWLVSEKSRGELARLIGVTPDRVALAFFTPLPFAGTAAPRQLAMANDGPIGPLRIGYRPAVDRPAGLIFVQAQQGPGVTMRQSGDFGPQGFVPTRRDSLPPGLQVRSGQLLQSGAPGDTMGVTRAIQGPLIVVQPKTGERGILIPGDGGAALPSLLRGQGAGGPGNGGIGGIDQGVRGTMPRADFGPPLGGPPPGPSTRALAPDRATLAPALQTDHVIAPAPLTVPPAATLLPPAPHAPAPIQPAPAAPVMVAPALPALMGPRVEASDPPAAPTADPAGPPIRIAPARRGLFGLAPAPFVEGDFVAALRGADGRWSVVQPAPEPFPNAWQRRVLLWFAIAVAVVIPLGWLYARRLVKPLRRFSAAAEQLGRDPSSAIGSLDGPAEIGRAARAFNQMQSRLRSFVDDRTAMIGAISHDLRTPLTRMRFRIEDAPDDVREGLLLEVDEMEAMITQVIDFIRDASAPAPREQLDLRALMGEVVEDARLVGGDVTVESMMSAPVEVDVLGMRRLLDNLLENAVKYGQRAHIRLRTEADSAIAEIIDEGPGVPDDEIERVFEPFYRSEAARASDKSGSGLGLAVCRSIARAHGGDIRLGRSDEGFRAEVRLPLAFGRERGAVFAE